MLAFMIKAAVAALKKFPEFNSSLDGDQLVMKNYFHIGFAADTPNGWWFPSSGCRPEGHRADQQEMGELAAKGARRQAGPGRHAGRLLLHQLAGRHRWRYFTPIINAPEVAIMGVCKSSIEPKWDGKQFAPRLMLPSP